MSKLPTLILNIGYHKTATTCWQHDIFPIIDSINYIGRKYNGDPYFPAKPNIFNRRRFALNIQLNNWLNNYTQQLDVDYDSSFQNSFLDKHNLTSKSKINVLSSENILRPFCVEESIKRFSGLKERYNLKILVFIRNQYDIIISRYIHDIQEKYNSEFKYSIIDSLSDSPGIECKWPFCSHGIQVCSCDSIGKKIISPQFYNYLELYNKLKKKFTASQVYFFPMESLKNKSKERVKKLLDFIGIDSSDEIIRNILGAKPIGGRSKEFKQEFFRTQEKEIEKLKKYCNNYYSPSNSKLSELYKMNLSEFNYPS